MLRVRLFRNADDEEVRFVLHSRRGAQSHTRQVARSRLHVPAMAWPQRMWLSPSAPCGASKASRAASDVVFETLTYQW